MQLAEIQSSKQISMTSLQIAELCDKRHDSVKRTIEILSKPTDKRRAVIARPHSVIVQNIANNRTYDIEAYVFSGEQGRLDSITIVAQLNPQFTAALVARWDELEKQAAKPQIALPNFTDPAAAAEAWAKEYREKQALAVTLEQAKPKINFYNKVGDSKNLLIASKIGQSFKTNPMSAVVLNKHLEKFDVYNMSIKSGRVFKQWFVDKGFGRMVQNDNGYPQAKFTTDGQAWIVEKFTSEGII